MGTDDDMRRLGLLSGYFEPSGLARPKGGIKAQSKRGDFGESWWAKRWIAVLESFDIGARLGRGRTYARKGQVLSIEVEKGRVKAKVQGSRAKPYRVTIQVKRLSPAEWEKLAKALAQQAIFAAKLLAGEMPQDIEKVFQAAKLVALPREIQGPGNGLLLPRLVEPLQAHRRGLLPAGRGVRPRSVPDLQTPGIAAGRAVPNAGERGERNGQGKRETQNAPRPG